MSFSPKVNLEARFSCALTFNISHDQKLKMKEIGELAANLLCLYKQSGISERG